MSDSTLAQNLEPGRLTPLTKWGGVTDPTLITLPLYEEVAA